MCMRWQTRCIRAISSLPEPILCFVVNFVTLKLSVAFEKYYSKTVIFLYPPPWSEKILFCEHNVERGMLALIPLVHILQNVVLYAEFDVDCQRFSFL